LNLTPVQRVVVVKGRSVEHLEELIDRFVVYAQTTTSIVQSAPVSARGVALDIESTP
jgi:hypothetical protein